MLTHEEVDSSSGTKMGDFLLGMMMDSALIARSVHCTETQDVEDACNEFLPNLPDPDDLYDQWYDINHLQQ